jgi:DNA-binding Lrp family transcriptional regulator
MLISLLSLNLGRLDSKARFTLASFYLRYEFTDTGPISIDELAGCLGVPTRECANALNLLVKESVLIARADSNQRAGRLKKSFRIHDDMVNKLGIANVVSRPLDVVPHLDVVEHLVRGPYIHATRPDMEIHAVPANTVRTVLPRASVPSRTSLLSRSNRLLLAVLSAHADRFGIVNSLGNVELCRLTGLEQTSLKQRIKKLIEMGFIRRHVPGVASPIFDEKLKSTYVLNLNHRQISSGTDMIGFVVHQCADEWADDVRYIGDVWFDLERWRNSATKHKYSLLEFSTPASVLRLFRHAPKHAIEQLQFFLSGCVTDLLARHWEQLDVAKSDFFLGVRGDISAFFRKPMRDVKDASLLDETEIIDFLWEMTIQFARVCKVRFSRIDGLAWSSLNFRLLPSDLRLGYSCLGMLLDGGAGSGWLLREVGEHAGTTKITTEALCPVELREKAGLLTPARAKTI